MAIYGISVAALLLTGPMAQPQADESAVTPALVQFLEQTPDSEPIIEQFEFEPDLLESVDLEIPIPLPDFSADFPERSSAVVADATTSGFTASSGPTANASPGTPSARFAGIALRGRSVVYVVDFSGSMLIAQSYVRQELIRSTSRLSPAQTFNVIFYAGQDAPVKLSKAPLRGTRAAKAAAREQILCRSLGAVGSEQQATQSVIAALTAALEPSAPEVVYFFTDGEFDRNAIREHLQRQLRRALPRPVVHVIACSEAEFPLLGRIAQDNGGRYRRVTAAELDAAIMLP